MVNSSRYSGGLLVPKEEADYSNYITHLSNIQNACSILTGFSFTGFIILISQVPTLQNTFAKIILFIMAFIINLLLFLLL